jgi:DNA-binding LacI/PurR family transcriptional regulator
MAATIRHVARAAGVSPSTVSRALARADLVSPTTRNRVLRAAAQLRYQPNRAARGLASGRTGNLGLIVPDLANPFFPGVVKGMEARVRAADYAVFIADSDEDASVELSLARSLARQVDGLVLCSPRIAPDEIRALAKGTRLVLLNRRLDAIAAVTVDNIGGMRHSVAHLVALGHRRIAYVAGPAASWSATERTRGLRAAAKAARAELVEIGSFPPRFESGVAAADLAVAAGVTAVIGYNDIVSLGLLSRLSARQIEVPAHISVVGCDDIAMAAMSNPALTTIALPKQEAGRAAADLLLRLLDPGGGGRSARVELPTQLVVRGSTGPAPSS